MTHHDQTMLFGAIFFIALFVGLIIYGINKMKEK